MTSPTTVEVWFKTTAGGVILGQQVGTPPGSVADRVPVIYVGQDGKLRAAYWWGSASPVTSATTVNDGQPHHVAITYDQTTFRVYLDSVLMGQKTTALQSYTSAQLSYQIGTGAPAGWPSAPSATWVYFAGQIDEVRAWRVARTASEICANIHRPLTGSEPGLIGYWRFDNPGGQQGNRLLRPRQPRHPRPQRIRRWRCR